MLNSSNYTVATPTISMTGSNDLLISYVLDGEISINKPSNSNDVMAGDGDYEGAIYTEGKITATFPVRSPSGSAIPPKQFSSFSHDGFTYLVTAVNETIGGSSPQKFSVEAEQTGVAV